MSQKKKILASIIIVNYNNAKYLKISVKSAINQNYKYKEIIVVDDKSEDNSIDILKSFKKKIILIKNQKKTSVGSYDQINSYYRGFLKAKGKYLFFLDSDDYFKKNKLKIIMKKFISNRNVDIFFDLPILKFSKKIKKKKFKQKKFIISNWPRFSPQSCISVKKDYAKEFFKVLKIKKFNSIWFDFRLATYSFLRNGNIQVIENYLTYYRQLENSASKKFKTFSKNWWIRRNEAHDYINFLTKKLKIREKFTLDKIFTKIVNKFFDKKISY